MKRFFILLLIPLVVGFAAPALDVFETVNSCGQGAYSSSDLCSGNYTYGLALTTDAGGFVWTASKSFSMWGASIHITHTIDGTITCRIGASSNLSSYIAEGTSGNISSTGYVDIEWASGCVSITNASTYYIGCIENSGNLAISDNDSSCDNHYNAAASGGWNMTQSDGQDMMWRAIEDD